MRRQFIASIYKERLFGLNLISLDVTNEELNDITVTCILVILEQLGCVAHASTCISTEFLPVALWSFSARPTIVPSRLQNINLLPSRLTNVTNEYSTLTVTW